MHILMQTLQQHLQARMPMVCHWPTCRVWYHSRHSWNAWTWARIFATSVFDHTRKKKCNLSKIRIFLFSKRVSVLMINLMILKGKWIHISNNQRVTIGYLLTLMVLTQVSSKLLELQRKMVWLLSSWKHSSSVL